MSKVNCVCFGFALLRLVIGLKISRHFLSQSELKQKPIVTRSRTFSRASCQLHVFASSFDWFTGLSVSFVIGQSNYYGFWFYDTQLKTALRDRKDCCCFCCNLLLKVSNTLVIPKGNPWPKKGIKPNGRTPDASTLQLSR